MMVKVPLVVAMPMWLSGAWTHINTDMDMDMEVDMDMQMMR